MQDDQYFHRLVYVYVGSIHILNWYENLRFQSVEWGGSELFIYTEMRV